METKEKLKILLSGLDSEEKLYYFVATQAFATIMGIKESNLLIFHEHNDMLAQWDEKKYKLCSRYHIDHVELYRDKRLLKVLIYKKELMENLMCTKSARDFLVELGYEAETSLESAFEFLKKRFKKKCPHEIGLFLGYPVDDVKNFISRPEKKCLYTGYWRVYGNLNASKKKMREFDDAKMFIMQQILKGIPPSQLSIKRLGC